MAPSPNTRTRRRSSAASATYSGPYAGLVNSAARRYGVPAFLLAALLKVESGFNPRARSGAGAEGIAQFMPATARGYGVNPWDPRSAIPGAARKLAHDKRSSGSWAGALRAYNTGSSNPSAAGTAYVDQVTAARRDLGGSHAGTNSLLAAAERYIARGIAKIIGTPYAGTHTLYGNWESDNAFDFALPTGSPVYALESGHIGPASEYGPLAGAGSDPHLLGLRVHLIGADEYYYAHLSKLVVKPGQAVKRGQLIGYSGSANGVQHLHLAARNGGKPLTSAQGQSLQASIASGVAANAGKVGGGALNFITGTGGDLLGGLANPFGSIAGGVGGAFDATKTVGQLAGRILEDPAYPFLWVLFVMLGLGLMLLGLLRMSGTKPADVAAAAGTAAKVGAVAAV
jgi:murein DD-endopeptidase MepM/ murein hydrolase activator NlpD